MDFEVKRLICTGLDVHKKSVTVAVCTTDPVTLEASKAKRQISVMRNAEKNRYQNSMTISCIRIDCVLTDSFGKTATNIMEYLLSDKPFAVKTG